MRRIAILLILLVSLLGAVSGTKSDTGLYEKIFAAISGHSGTVKVFSVDPEYRKAFAASEMIIPVSSIAEADIVVADSRTLCGKIAALHTLQEGGSPIVFATDYHLLKEYPFVVGALYWKKGRSQLLFIRSRLQRYNIELGEEFSKYIVESL